MTVERGPVAFDYQDLEVAFFSACDDSQKEEFYKTQSFDVYYLEPCSPVDISSPLDDWVVIPSSGSILNITLDEYDETDEDLEYIRVQYRRSQGDGAWLPVDDILKDSLGPVFTVVPWNTQGLVDGFYEVRATTQCIGGLNPGISHVKKGRIERTPPELFGNPEPADGVYESGDEISITFNEPIRCATLIQADFFNNNNVGMYNATTGDLIDVIVSCSEDKITLTPNVPNNAIENQFLRVEVDSVQDLVGNFFDHAQWEFFVNQNPLSWSINSLEDFKYLDESKRVQRTITNTGGSIQVYELSNIPEWVTVFPRDGQINPGDQQVITFDFDENLVAGSFLDTIFLEGVQGDEPLPIDFRVLCRPPSWEVNPSDYAYSMNITAELDIEGVLSTDPQDILGAFIDGELRGVTQVEYNADVDKYLAFLTIYSNIQNEEFVEFQIWDASTCRLYGEVVETYLYLPESSIGSPLSPETLHTNGLIME